MYKVYARGQPLFEMWSPPTEVFIKRAALAVTKSRKLEVATKYQCQLPPNQRGCLKGGSC